MIIHCARRPRSKEQPKLILILQIHSSIGFIQIRLFAHQIRGNEFEGELANRSEIANELENELESELVKVSQRVFGDHIRMIANNFA